MSTKYEWTVPSDLSKYPTEENVSEVYTLDQEMQDAVITIINKTIPDGAKIMCLAFTGGRAFGWGGFRHDVDIRGFIQKPSDSIWFDTMHIGCGTGGYDIRLSTIEHLNEIEIQYKYWTTWQDMADPFYIDTEFDYDGFMDKCKPEYIKFSMIHNQFSRWERLKDNVRPALHTYRIMMTKLWFAMTGEMRNNCTKMNNEFFDLPIYEEYRKTYALDLTGTQVSAEEVEVELRALMDTCETVFKEYCTEPKPETKSTIDSRKQFTKNELQKNLDARTTEILK